MGALKVKNPDTGLWMVVSTQGPPGPPGEDGEQGVSSVIVGSFGAVQTPAGLPPDGLLPIDWDGPGKPAAPFQMEQGWSLYYDKPTDPLDGHLFQHVGVAIDPLGWIDIGLIQGPEGPPGVEGPMGPPNEQVEVGPDTPAEPTVELWFDTDDARILGPTDLPLGGLVGHLLVKATDLDGDVRWTDTGVNVVIADNLEVGDNINILGDGRGLWLQSGAAIHKKSGGGLYLRKSSGGQQVRIENNDGSNGTDIVVANGNTRMTDALRFDAETGDKVITYDGAAGARFGISILSGTQCFFVESVSNKHSFHVGGTERALIDQYGLGPRTNHNVTWLNGFGGTCQFHVNPATVSFTLHDTDIPVLAANATTKMCAYPAGVPAPWSTLRFVATILTAGAWGLRAHAWVEARGDGLWLQLYNGTTTANDDNLSGTGTWTR